MEVDSPRSDISLSTYVLCNPTKLLNLSETHITTCLIMWG